MKIVMFEFKDLAAEPLGRLRLDNEVITTPEPLTAENAAMYTDADIITSFINSSLVKETLRLMPKLKLIALRSAGFDMVDMEYCHAQGITVCNAAGYGDDSVAEHAFALLLALSKRIVETGRKTRAGYFGYVPEPGFELFGKTFGVIGTGRIGRRAASIAKGFGMDVLAYDKYPKLQEAKEIGFQYVSLEELLARTDIVSLHVPGSPETNGLINDHALGLMKHGAILINTARGAVVDTQALIRALASGKLGGAGLDVLPQEPALRNLTALFEGRAPLGVNWQDTIAGFTVTRFENVIVTPHNAYNTIEAERRLISIPVDNILAFMAGKPTNIVS